MLNSTLNAEPQSATTEKTVTLKTSTVAEMFKAKGITQVIPKVRVNSSGYPYVTCIDKDNVAENVYFSKASSPLVSEGQVIAKGFFDKLQVGYTTNSAGEARIKFISNSDRVSVMDIL